MKVPQTKEDLESLIANKIEESFELEYKSSGALEKLDKNQIKFDIAKDVSAMANAAGGLIVYGIKESGQMPKEITPVSKNKFSKELLEQIINSNISPKIEGLKIASIQVDDNSGVAYIVEIPQGSTAHQNTIDRKYYKRYNFEAVAMLDYEIRDAMNRVKHPIIELNFEIKPYRYDAGMASENTNCLIVRPYNKGDIYAQFVNFSVRLPKNVVHRKQSVKKESDCDEYYGENVCEGRFDPILPKTYGRPSYIVLAKNACLDQKKLHWQAHADNALIQTGSIVLMNIPMIYDSD